VLAKRRTIQQRRRVDDTYMKQWFRFRPVSLPLKKPVERSEPLRIAKSAGS
jgi:hypothetical protein